MASSPNVLQILGFLNARVTPDAEVAAAIAGNPSKIVTLVRGASAQGALAAMNAMSAGGSAQNAACGPPTESQIISQVGGSQPGKPQEKLPEFTSVAGNAEKWAKRGGFLMVQIRAKYLGRGDVGQSGWVCRKEAPLEGANFIDHPNPIAVGIPNAD